MRWAWSSRPGRVPRHLLECAGAPTSRCAAPPPVGGRVGELEASPTGSHSPAGCSIGAFARPFVAGTAHPVRPQSRTDLAGERRIGRS